jgi:5'-nucleotidase
MSPTRALITNDDGVDSEGLYRLARSAVAFGLEVVVAAPLHESSGSSAALAAVQDGRRIVVEPRAMPGLDGVPVFAVDAAPGFIALIATREAFGPPPDLVLSGVNRGLNAGHAVLHSGTVGAAMTARVNGCRALAVSMDVGDTMHWDTAEPVLERVLPVLVDLDRPVVLNVNVPNVPAAALRGIRQATLASFGAVQTTISRLDEGTLHIGVADTVSELEPGTDASLVASNFATVTALEPLCASDAPLGFEPSEAAERSPAG